MSKIRYPKSYTFLLKGKDQIRQYDILINLVEFKEIERSFSQSILQEEEYRYYDTLIFEARKKSYLYGRYSLKSLVCQCIGQTQFNKILIRNGIFHQPVIVNTELRNKQGSISHCNSCAASLLYDELLILGIDIEDVGRDFVKALNANITEHEERLIRGFHADRNLISGIMWTAKEALSKCIKTGFSLSLNILQIEEIKLQGRYYVTTYKNFVQYKTLTMITGNYYISITLPKLIDIVSDFDYLLDDLEISNNK
jgi:phosphopantetheinyl transferase (holo-ACP synthase)